MKGLRSRIDYVLKHNPLAQAAYVNAVSLAMRVFGAFVKTDDKLILFSAHGRGYNDSPRAIYEAMKKDSRFDGYKFVWAVENPKKANIPGCAVIAPDTPGYFMTSLKAGYWITCVNIERGLRYKKKDTRYLNTWHGIPLKTIGNAANGRKDYDFSHIDFFCCSCEYDKAIYQRDFGVKPQSLIESGLPRNDALYRADGNKVKAVRDKLSIPDGKKAILYAPTWRDSTDGGMSFTLKPPIDLELWREKLADDYVLLVRAHAYTDALDVKGGDGFVRDVSDYPDVNELMIASDILITDYSSIAFDYAILLRPIICFGYDYEEYKKSRGLYLDLDDVMPSGVVRDERTLLARIENMDYVAEAQKTRGFKDAFLQYGSDATRICINALFGEK
ncbi:MAG: CDP-glycerol glycerophosphotransferase family protein [Clostridia bacterium]|nr:CDP-glycerol glycerophosphotransferase family protein [Clostridia bacterium]